MRPTLIERRRGRRAFVGTRTPIEKGGAGLSVDRGRILPRAGAIRPRDRGVQPRVPRVAGTRRRDRGGALGRGRPARESIGRVRHANRRIMAVLQGGVPGRSPAVDRRRARVRRSRGRPGDGARIGIREEEGQRHSADSRVGTRRSEPISRPTRRLAGRGGGEQARARRGWRRGRRGGRRAGRAHDRAQCGSARRAADGGAEAGLQRGYGEVGRRGRGLRRERVGAAG